MNFWELINRHERIWIVWWPVTVIACDAKAIEWCANRINTWRMTRGSVLCGATLSDSASVASSAITDTGKGGSGTMSLNCVGKRLVHDGLPAWLASEHVGNEMGVHSTTGRLSVDSKFDPSDATVSVWPLTAWCKVWGGIRGARDLSDTIDEEVGVLEANAWSGVPSQFMGLGMLDGTRS